MTFPNQRAGIIRQRDGFIKAGVRAPGSDGTEWTGTVVRLPEGDVLFSLFDSQGVSYGTVQVTPEGNLNIFPPDGKAASTMKMRTGVPYSTPFGEVTLQSDGSVLFRNPYLGTLEMRQDGTVVVTDLEGSALEMRPDGSADWTHSSGVLGHTWRQDGFSRMWIRKG
jgi:hypothetical protein